MPAGTGHSTGVAEFGHPGVSALQRCVAMPVGRFAAEVWSRAPLLSPADRLAGPSGRPGDGFADLFDAAAVDRLVSEQGLRTPFLRMAKAGTVLPPARFTRSGGKGAGIADQAADDKVLDLLVDGSTLVLQGLHRTWPPLVAFAAELAAELGHSVQINAYVTPPQNQGFAAHYDTHDVFVLQIAGRKRWSVHDPVLAAPLPAQPWDGDAQRRAAVAAAAAGTPVIDTVLAPGDALYLPRGYLHSAVAQGELSVHLTVGVHVLTRHDVLRELLAQLPDVEALRASLPMGTDLADPAALRPQVAATVAALQDWLAGAGDAATERVADGLGRTLRADTRPAALGPLAQAAAIAALGPAIAVRLRPGLRWRLSAGPDGLELRVLDKTITMPAGTETAVKAVLSGAAVGVGELPGLDADEQLVLARRLLREGVLVPA